MRIVLIGQAAFGARTLEALLEAGESVVAAYAPPAKEGAKPDPLKLAAASRGIPVLEPVSYRDDAVFSQYAGMKPDLTILAFVTAIIPPRYFDAASVGAICYHPSLLPRHRGASGINWAIMMGDTRTGLTIFWPDGGIDTGPVLLQKEVAIGPDDTTGAVYFDRLFPMGIEAIVESVRLIKAGRAARIPQDEKDATYEPPCNDKVARIDWSRSAADLYNFIRGCDPQPGAFTTWRGEKVRLLESRLLARPSSPAAPGVIVAMDGDGLVIEAAGGALRVARIRTAAGRKLAAAGWARDQGIEAGQAFGD